MYIYNNISLISIYYEKTLDKSCRQNQTGILSKRSHPVVLCITTPTAARIIHL